MKQRVPVRRNLWALTVLGLLWERPMHPYEMQRLIRERHKDDLLDLKPGSLYHAIERLERGGLIEPLETSRAGRRPERTVYQLTEAGLDTLLEWLREMLSRPERDPMQFMAAIANLARLPAEEVAQLLEARVIHLEIEIAGLDAVLRLADVSLPRLVLLENELARARRVAERDWVQEVAADIRNGRLHWDLEELRRTFGAPNETAKEEGQ